LRIHLTFLKPIVVSVGVSTLGSSERLFSEPGAKINGAYVKNTQNKEKRLKRNNVSRIKIFVNVEYKRYQ